jgi:hypothetical protein
MRYLTTLALIAMLPLAAKAQSSLNPLSPSFSPVNNESATVFKRTPEGDLKITVSFPSDWTAADQRAAIVFFFCRRLCEWIGGSIPQQSPVLRASGNGGGHG